MSSSSVDYFRKIKYHMVESNLTEVGVVEKKSFDINLVTIVI